MLNTNQEIIIKSLFAFNTTAEARESVLDVLSAAQFNSGLGALKRAGYIVKKDDGNYEITDLANDEIEFEEFAQPVTKEIKGDVVAAEIMVVEPKVEAAPEVLDGDFEVVSEIDSPIVELYAPMVYSHYQAVAALKPTKAPRKPRGEKKEAKPKVEKMSEDELMNIHDEFINQMGINQDFVRSLDTTGGSWFATRFSKNENRIKALETFKNGNHRVYLGKVSDELFAEFAAIADRVKTATNQMTHYMDFKFGSENLAKVKELLGEIVVSE